MSDPLDAAVEDKVRNSFAKQSMMKTIGAQLESVEHGKVVISAPILEGFLQQQDFGHGGLVFSLGDTAAGFAALSVMPMDQEVLTVEVKINLLAPATGQLIATGRVIKSGKRLVIVSAEVATVSAEGTHAPVAVLQGTMIPVNI